MTFILLGIFIVGFVVFIWLATRAGKKDREKASRLSPDEVLSRGASCDYSRPVTYDQLLQELSRRVILLEEKLRSHNLM